MGGRVDADGEIKVVAENTSNPGTNIVYYHTFELANGTSFTSGLIKTISYSMTQYILADCPEVRAKDALKLSMRMMNGHKWEFFVLLLSFLGWGILTVLTLGILGVFYVGPYQKSSFAAYYLEIKREALRTGAVTREQLDGLQPV